MKRNCPFCGEEILAKAKKCKFCGEIIDDSSDYNNSCNFNPFKPANIWAIILLLTVFSRLILYSYKELTTMNNPIKNEILKITKNTKQKTNEADYNKKRILSDIHDFNINNSDIIYKTDGGYYGYNLSEDKYYGPYDLNKIKNMKKDYYIKVYPSEGSPAISAIEIYDKYDKEILRKYGNCVGTYFLLNNKLYYINRNIYKINFNTSKPTCTVINENDKKKNFNFGN